MAMQRLILAISLALLLGACGSVAVEAEKVAARQPAVSDEMDCMADCLQDTSETCETCADSCLQRSTSPAVASTP
jgi:predicted lipoprotein with Yx(FWY)xxD motif